MEKIFIRMLGLTTLGLALLGIGLSSIPALVLLLPIVPTYTLLLVLGVFLGVGGASFAIHT